jgi:HD-GYP domain-containing protein (c-di-GMP phosphodiesterase class II)
MAVGLEGFESHDRTYGPSAGDALLEQLGGKLRSAPRGRVFHAGRHELVILLGGNDERRACGYARGLRRLIAQSTSGSAASPAASVGFVAIGPEGEDPDLVLSAAAGALREARRRPERLLGLPAGAGIEAGKGAGASTEKAQAAVRALFEAVRARDPRLAEHSKAVSDVARRIGYGMGLPRDQVEALAAGALLHDVGKIALPNAILQKPGPLTEEEYGVVRQHPVLGARILGPLGELSAALPAVRHHHERFDGGGYPDGLRGERIPFPARVTLVADAFDSMTRDRVYQRGVPAKAALQVLERNSGSQFDPDVVAALARIVEESGNLSAGSVG